MDWEFRTQKLTEMSGGHYLSPVIPVPEGRARRLPEHRG